ncbi:MAG: glycosyl hydrolase family 18 protein [Terrimicrobiaceae bacterium]
MNGPRGAVSNDTHARKPTHEISTLFLLAISSLPCFAHGHGEPDQPARFFISYDDRQSIGAKCDYINAQKFRGAMIWELSGDLPTALASFPS